MKFGTGKTGWRGSAGVATAVIAATGLLGCAGEQLDPFVKKAQMQVNAQSPGKSGPVQVVMKPVTGAPEAVSSAYIRQLNAAAATKDIALLADADAIAPLTLYSYLLIERSGGDVKILYISDITDTKGEKVQRISGEEIVPAPASGDAWAAVTPEKTRLIAEKAVMAIGEASHR